ncbi:chemotaxis protein CheD [Desulfonatronum thiosulfatophilum]|uniref:Probable chemoreceptor glutamine deamidase CheD n=1 Tax=Desulfonatronum thiosulfatophilum TaxID=617002 RepID=A0A1G6A1B8_9BACT|nr:chemotaxis protein CheD [Desulfonatronum thiosulfatophilum]SDB01773.1 chemotaxis protein CheD [Desulfonatronum thiosulfatophilum]
MNSAHFSNYPVFHLQIGECFLSKKPTLVCTVLGSCVAVSFFEPVIRLGGIFHALLPDSPDNDGGTPTTQPCRFVDQSIQRILSAVERNGGRRRDIQIKVFGGAELFGFSGGTGSAANSVGRRNVRTAIVELEKTGLRIMASDVGGTLGRKLYFLSDTGEVWVKRIQRTLFSE